MYNVIVITKKNFGLIHVYFLYTVFRVTYRTLISKGYMTTKLKIAVGEGWGILSVGRVQLEFNLGRAGGKKSPVFKKHLVPVAALGNNFIPFVKCGPGVGQGDVRLLHQTEVADPHPPAVRWRKAEDGPVLIVCGLLILQLPDVT